MKTTWKSLYQTTLFAALTATGLTLTAGCSTSSGDSGRPGDDIALFVNPDYVGVSFGIEDVAPPESAKTAEDGDSGHWDQGDEASNLFVGISYLGYNPLPFIDIDAASLTETLAGKGVLIIPELEGPRESEGEVEAALGGDLTADAKGVLTGFVNDGGLIVVFGDWTNTEMSENQGANLINSLLGTSVAGVSQDGPPDFGTRGTLQVDAAKDTSFEGGPAAIPPNDGNYPLKAASLPDNAKVIYAGGSEAWVVVFPHGSGAIVYISYDFYSAAPVGDQDNGLNEVLARTISYRGVLPVHPKTVSLFLNNYYVDTNFTVPDINGGFTGSEASNEYYSLNGLGYHVTPWISTDEAATARALFGAARVAIIPEQEQGYSVEDDTSDASFALVDDFVYNGGTLILHGDDCGDSYELDLIYRLMELEVECYEGVVEPITLQTDAADGTSFENGPATLDSNDAIGAIDEGDVDYAGGNTIYADDDGHAVVATIPYGAGTVIWLGYDWYDAAPLGDQDGGWLDVLKASVEYIPVMDF